MAKKQTPLPRRFDDYGDEMKLIAIGMKLKNPPKQED